MCTSFGPENFGAVLFRKLVQNKKSQHRQIKKFTHSGFLVVTGIWLLIMMTYDLQCLPRHQVLLRVDGLLRFSDQQDLEPFQVAGEGFLLVSGLHSVLRASWTPPSSHWAGVVGNLQCPPRHQVLLDVGDGGLLRVSDQRDLGPFQVAGDGFLLVAGLHPVWASRIPPFVSD